MPSTPFPLPLRNALAELTLAAFDDEDALAAITWLAAPAGCPPPAAAARLAAAHLVDAGSTTLLAVHAPWDEAVAHHAHRALHALARARRRPAEPAVETAGPASRDEARIARALRRASALWAEGLFFEVHEVLEVVWQPTMGPLRHALQGLIQIAVAWHHLGHGNRRGARNLLREGRERLADGAAALPAVDVDAVLASTAPWLAALAGDAALPSGGPPPLPVRDVKPAGEPAC